MLLPLELPLAPGVARADKDLRRDGPRVFVTICHPTISANATDLYAVIDTGATHTLIGREHADDLRLRLHPTTGVAGLGGRTLRAFAATAEVRFGSGTSDEFSIGRVQLKVLDDATVFGPRPYKCILGRDVLAEAHLFYDGPRGRFHLWPS